MGRFLTYEKALVFYKACKNVSMPYHLKNQLLRASSSIALNLAEGAYRFTKKEQKRFYEISFSSLKECKAVFDLAEIKVPLIFGLIQELERMLYKLLLSRA